MQPSTFVLDIVMLSMGLLMGFVFLGTLYEEEKFQLQFKFGARYPFDSPEVSNLKYVIDHLVVWLVELLATKH